MPATQRYQDAPSNASTDLATESPDENLESHAVSPDGATPQVVAEPDHFPRAGGLLDAGRGVPP
jgi:hypothetical protein